MPLTARVRSLYRKRRYLKWMIHDERTNRLPISRTERLTAWRQGFLTFSYRMCEIDRHGPQDYVTDRMRYLRTSGLNNPYTQVLDDKLVFWEVFRRHAGLLPETYAILRKDRVLPISSAERVTSYEDIVALLARRGRLVVKPTTGGGGVHIGILEHRPEGCAWNGKLIGADQLRSRLAVPRERLLMEFVEQASYAREIHPPSTNTIRALSMWDD